MPMSDKIKKLRTIMSPKQANVTHEELYDEWLKKLTAEEIMLKRNDLVYSLRAFWLKSFHFEDLQFIPDQEGLSKYLPYVQIALITIVLFKVIF